jgi:predicted RNase H-like HicB family nuclease
VVGKRQGEAFLSLSVAWSLEDGHVTNGIAFVLSARRGIKMDIQFTTQIFKEGDTFVAYAPELDLSSCGTTIEHAKAHLEEAVTAFIEEAERMGTLSEILEEAGFTKEAAGWKAPEIVVQEKTRLALAR